MGGAAPELDYRQALLQGQAQIGVWGVGHIGYSTLSSFARQGVRGVGFDVDPDRVATINRGEWPIHAVERWLGFDPADLFRAGVAVATTDWRELSRPDLLTHFICVPTERSGRPDLAAFDEVAGQMILGLLREPLAPPLVIVESTLPPGTIDRRLIQRFQDAGLRVGRDVLLGCAPRRDWLGSSERSLRTLPRVVGGADQRSSRVMLEVLGIVCQQLRLAPDHRHAEAVKSIENAYRQVEITLANELSLAYPDLDMRTILELVGTKWNVGTFRPSFGIGGYCIPLASEYVLAGASHPERLTLLQAAAAGQGVPARSLADYLLAAGNLRQVGILGLSYAADLKVWQQSPTLQLVPLLLAGGLEVRVHDPYYRDDEIRRLVGVEPLQFPADLGELDALLLVAAHQPYRALAPAELLRRLNGCRLVLDNAGLWADLDFASHGVEYHLAGDRGWLSGLRPDA